MRTLFAMFTSASPFMWASDRKVARVALRPLCPLGYARTDRYAGQLRAGLNGANMPAGLSAHSQTCRS